MTEEELRIYWQAAKETWPRLAMWTLEVSRQAKSRGGACRFGSWTIGISEWILAAPEEDVLDVLLHEIAHALTGPWAGHGQEWRRVAEEIGARPERRYPRRLTAYRPPAPWTLVCPDCGPISRPRYRRGDLTRLFCRGCGEESRGQLEWVENGRKED